MPKQRAPEHGRGPREDRGVLVGQIKTAARASFAEHGWAGTTMRGIARDAGVDPALIHYYFGSKQELLDKVTTLPPEWIESVRATVTVPIRRRGEAILRNVLAVYDDPELGDVWRSLVLTAAHEPQTREKLVATLAAGAIHSVAAELEGEERRIRASLVAAQVMGVVMMRVIWRVEPLASMSEDELVGYVAPTLQRYLSGRLGSVGQARS